MSEKAHSTASNAAAEHLEHLLPLVLHLNVESLHQYLLLERVGHHASKISSTSTTTDCSSSSSCSSLNTHNNRGLTLLQHAAVLAGNASKRRPRTRADAAQKTIRMLEVLLEFGADPWAVLAMPSAESDILSKGQGRSAMHVLVRDGCIAGVQRVFYHLQQRQEQEEEHPTTTTTEEAMRDAPSSAPRNDWCVTC